ncbi:hypothetical protein GCM10009733_087340 [Nonomuraea maheshkhaliensis]|uniref:Secreted protein n=1 Tax=Nonomuraea maheshkhaliensis TaxID=419590 RepID=A0ABP4SR64_9ACTN
MQVYACPMVLTCVAAGAEAGVLFAADAVACAGPDGIWPEALWQGDGPWSVRVGSPASTAAVLAGSSVHAAAAARGLSGAVGDLTGGP